MRGSPVLPSVFGPPRLTRALFFLLVALSCWLQDLRTDARGTLPQQEVDALRLIAATLRIPATLWDFSLNPCDRQGNWAKNTSDQVTTNLVCDCNATTNVCRVIIIELKGQNLTGVLPREFRNLTSLTQIDLTRNYINGSIPADAWVSLPLRSISLLGNRLSGPIPDEIGEITTLQSLVLENNLLQGSLPPGLGKLANLNRLFLSANNFTGELPETFGNLKNLSDFRIDGNGISGKIPSFIGNWKKLQRFDMQGTNLEGPFPAIFSTLQGITELRVSDWKNTNGSFPSLDSMLNMRYLVLRNCSISGSIPEYIGKMTGLKLLDLSFNNLTGSIPNNFENLREINNVYLTNNALSGPIPSWILRSRENLDISYNTFTVSDTDSMPSNCRQGDQNFIASFLQHTMAR